MTRVAAMEPDALAWEEHALRDAVLAGHEAAWRALYERSFDAVYAFVYHRVGRQSHRADEVVQEAWLVAVRRIASFDPARGSFESWLKGIAENVLKNQRRRWTRDARSLPLEACRAENTTPNEERTLEVRELVALVFTALPGRYQDVLRAKYQEQLSVADIAARSGGTPKSIESLLSRARESFRNAYEKLAGEP
ncbi:MAG TPA: sigma-70 family RNA polymerase sigma factor [Pirellulales bacterium]|nr:sigma-70 family RNA polymerase sigma factor [Pirellulales bacterium]